MLKPYEEDGVVIEFYLTLCFDLFYDILKFGDRRQLTKLERVGRRFHRLVEEWFGERPFLRLNIWLDPEFAFFVRYKLKFIINGFI